MVDISQGDYRIYFSTDNIYLQHLQYNKILTIEKFSSNVYESDPDILNKVVLYGAIKPHAILGISRIGNYDFLVYVKVCVLVGSVEEAQIFKIKETELIPIVDDITASNLSSEIKSYVNGIKNLLQLGFFYSFHYDLTNSKQKQARNKSNNILESAERKFFWNFNLYKKFNINEKLNVNKIWMVVCICGYFGIVKQMIGNSEIGLYLISRRSVHHAGTRYNTRGIDDDGHVANYIESEQIIKFSNHILSYLQIRGSAPIFFQQTGMTAQTQITRIPEMTSPAFLKHMEEIQKDYQMVFIVNLMNSNKPNEQVITQNLENQIKMNSLKSCRYYFFDFQNECKYDNYEKLDAFINNLENVFNIFKFYCEDTNTGEIHKEQCGVMRTNCLDCLDRTNVIQTRIAWRMLELQVRFIIKFKA
jgi:hypothetical protein